MAKCFDSGNRIFPFNPDATFHKKLMGKIYLQEMKDKKAITLCASLSFYSDLFEIEKQLKKTGFKVIIPKTARKMQKSGNFDVASHKAWYQNENDYKKKKALMDDHFKKILRSDAVLVINNEKKGVKSYIGGNVLMEMAVAYLQKIPIYLWNQIDDKSPYEEEIKAMRCIFLNQDLSKIHIKE